MSARLKNRRLSSYFFLALNTICWGAALVVVKPSLEFITPSRYLLYRFFVAIILSLPLLFYYLPKIKHLGVALKKITLAEIIGTSLALPILYTGLALTGAVEASFIATTGPIFIIFVGMLVLHERQEKNEWLGLALAFLGTFLISVTPALNGSGTASGNTLTGNALIILYNLICGFYFILAKKWYHGLPKLFVSTISFYVGFVTSLFISWWEVDLSLVQLLHTIQLDFTHVSVWVAALYMGLFGSIIGLSAYLKGQDGIEASEASMFAYLQPLVYVPLGFALLGETISWVQVAGLAIVLIGVVIAERRRF